MKKLSLILGCVLLLAGIAQAAEKPVIRIGARVFTEQTLLAEITSQYLRTKGYDARVTGGLGSNLARSAQESGRLDLIWEYTGVSLVAYNHIDEKLDSEQSYARVKELDAKKGLVWLSPSRFSNTYALALPEKVAQEHPEINSISDLKGKTISVTRGAIEDIELTAVAPKEATIKRFEDNNSTIAAYLAGQVDLIASGNVVMVAISERNPKRVPALKVKLKDSPVYVGVNKNEPALLEKVNQILVAAKADGSLGKNAMQWLKEPLPADL